jgi:hypothetical protein
MLLDTKNKNIYSLWVGISTVFEKCGHFLFTGDGTTKTSTVIAYIPSYVTWHKTQEYIWGGNFIGFWDIWSLPVSRGQDYSVWSWLIYHHMLLDTRNENIYGLIRARDISSFQYVLKNAPYCAPPPRPPGTMTLTNLGLYYVCKLFCKFELYGPNGSWEKDLFRHVPFLSTCKKKKTLLWPHSTPGAMILTNFLCTMSESFPVNFSSFDPGVLEKKIFRIFFLCQHM